MTTLVVGAEGEVFFVAEILEHLGISPGDRLELRLTEDGGATLSAWKPAGSIEGFLGLLQGKINRSATLAELNEAAAQGWSGQR